MDDSDIIAQICEEWYRMGYYRNWKEDYDGNITHAFLYYDNQKDQTNYIHIFYDYTLQRYLYQSKCDYEHYGNEEMSWDVQENIQDFLEDLDDCINQECCECPPYYENRGYYGGSHVKYGITKKNKPTKQPKKKPIKKVRRKRLKHKQKKLKLPKRNKTCKKKSVTKRKSKKKKETKFEIKKQSLK